MGAEVLPGGGVHFRVWAPRRHNVEVVLEPVEYASHRESVAVALAPEEGAISQDLSPRQLPAAYTATASMESHSSIPIPPRVFSLRGRTVRRR